jgi:hypothetical protein
VSATGKMVTNPVRIFLLINFSIWASSDQGVTEIRVHPFLCFLFLSKLYDVWTPCSIGKEITRRVSDNKDDIRSALEIVPSRSLFHCQQADEKLKKLLYVILSEAKDLLLSDG